MHGAELSGRLGSVGASSGGEDLEGADGGQHDGDTQVVAKEGGGGVDLGDVDQHPRTEGHAVEGEAVAAHGGFGLGASHEIVPCPLNQVLAGLLHYFFVADKVGGHVDTPPRMVSRQYLAAMYTEEREAASGGPASPIPPVEESSYNL